MKRIYLDNNATTALDPKVLQAMLQELSGPPANPASIHSFGKDARALLSAARKEVARFFQVKPEETFFTSGGTESLNWLLGSLQGHLITTQIEHSAIYETLQKKNATFLPVGQLGTPTPDQIATAIREDTVGIILTLSNSETGVKIPIIEIADLALQKGIPLYLDAVSYIGKEAFPHHPAIQAIALSAHKFHGPKGVGALICRSKIPSFLSGGGQEFGKRSGTENLAGILGLAEALRLLENQSEITQYILTLRSHFEQTLLKALPNATINGQGPRICNTSNIAFRGIDGETLLIQLDRAGIAASHGSACSSGSLEPSRVLIKMGIDRKTARSSIRFSFSRQNTMEEIDLALEKIIHEVSFLNRMNAERFDS